MEKTRKMKAAAFGNVFHVSANDYNTHPKTLERYVVELEQAEHSEMKQKYLAAGATWLSVTNCRWLKWNF